MENKKIIRKKGLIVLITAVCLIIIAIVVMLTINQSNKVVINSDKTEEPKQEETKETDEPEEPKQEETKETDEPVDDEKEFQKVFRYYFDNASQEDYAGLLYDYYEENDISFGMIQLDYLVRTNIMDQSTEGAYALGDNMKGDLGKLFTGISALKKDDTFAYIILLDARSDEEHLEEELQFLEMSGYSYVGTIDDDGNMTDSFVESTLEEVDRTYADANQLKLYDNDDNIIHRMEIDGLEFYVYAFTVNEGDHEFKLIATYMDETITLMTYEDIETFDFVEGN